jgi:hypothetical protein
VIVFLVFFKHGDSLSMGEKTGGINFAELLIALDFLRETIEFR